MSTPVSRVFLACLTYEKCLCAEHDIELKRASVLVATFGTFASFLLFSQVLHHHWILTAIQCAIFLYTGWLTGSLSRKLAAARAETSRAIIARGSITHSAQLDEEAFLTATAGPPPLVN